MAAVKIRGSKMYANDDSGIEQRFQRNTYIVIVIVLVAGWLFSGWRMALGALLGGALSLFNIRWLVGSVRAVLSQAAVTQGGRVPAGSASKFVLRYLVIATVIAAAMWTGDFHPLGIGIGFAAFVGGVMIEAAYQLYLSFRHFESDKNISGE